MKEVVPAVMLAAAPAEAEPEFDTSKPLQCEKFGQALTVGVARARSRSMTRGEYLETAGMKDPTELDSTVLVSPTVKLVMDTVHPLYPWAFELDPQGKDARVVATRMCRDLEQHH